MANGILKRQFNFYNSSFHNAGFHNSIYRGQYLGTSVTIEQQNEISAGTFNNLFIGDYWVINNNTWHIAAFDYFLNKGDTKCTTHHILLIPYSVLGIARQQPTTSTTAGGYKGSSIWTDWFASATGTGNAVFNNAFGIEHALSHRESISNAVTNGKSSGWEWIDVPCGNLLNECMIFGTTIYGDGYDIGANNSQLPLFRLAPELSAIRHAYWLSTVANAESFSLVDRFHEVNLGGASHRFNIRPYFVYA